MKSLVRLPKLTFLIFLFCVPWAVAQEKEITAEEFQAFLKKSIAVTKTSPYRKTVTVETGDSPRGSWKPYSSWVSEYVFPDRSHDRYASGSQGESIWIGNIFYRRSTDESWSASRKPTGLSVSSPSSLRGFGDRLVKFHITSTNAPEENPAVIIREISKRKNAAADADERLIYFSSWFFENGVLNKYENIGFNGRDWVRTTEIYEYDRNIRIEAPLK
jgi:hypothetical protein